MSIKAEFAWHNPYMPDALTRGSEGPNANVREQETARQKNLEVAAAQVMKSLADQPEKQAILADIINSKYECMKRIAENLTLTQEERRVLEDRRKRLERLKTLAEERKLDDEEAMRLMELVLTEEDKKLLESQLFEKNMFV